MCADGWYLFLRKVELRSYGIGRAFKQWVTVVAYVDNGYIDLYNNSAERSLRLIALGRKNYLFAGSVTGGLRAAVLY